MKALYIAVAAMMLTACAQRTWVKPGGDQTAFRQDRAACHFEGVKSVAGSAKTITAFDEVEVETACMKAKGWHLE